MMKKIKSWGLGLALLAIMIFSACSDSWLDAKPNKALVVPSTIADFQALLDAVKGAVPMNANLPCLSFVGDGDYYISDNNYNSLGLILEKSAYIWAETVNFYDGQTSPEWTSAYAQILQHNVVLDGILSLKVDDFSQTAYNNVKGSALFFRSYVFYNLSQQYCKVYNATTANMDLGLPLRLSSNINLTVNRATVQETYNQMINDLLKAAPLLPVSPLFPTRPSKPAVFALLARLYLAQENYSKALLYADSCLQLKNELLDYNELSTTSKTPLSYFNKEVIFHSQLISYSSYNPSRLIVDPGLYKTYNSNDLRRSIYFTTTPAGIITNKTGYIGSAVQLFGGIATDEMFLVRAECYARVGNTAKAMDDLNDLLKKRHITGSFTELAAANTEEALTTIIAERRKELCFRNLRWSDLRRLNKDPRFQVTLTRIVNGKTYTLEPNSSKYVLPLDPIETTIGGLEQNLR